MSTPEKKPILLLVEDDYQVRRLIPRFIGTGFELKIAADGTEAIRIIQESIVDGRLQLDAVLTDWNMPGAKGNKVLEAIVAADPKGEVLKAAMTGRMGENRDAMQAAGAELLLAKPDDIGMGLRERLTAALAAKRAK